MNIYIPVDNNAHANNSIQELFPREGQVRLRGQLVQYLEFRGREVDDLVINPNLVP